MGTKVLQFESGITLGKEKHNLLNTETKLFNWDYSVRYGIWREELEISLMGSFQRNKVSYTVGTAEEDPYSNFKSNTLGAKYLVYDPYRKRELEGPNLYSWKKTIDFSGGTSSQPFLFMQELILILPTILFFRIKNRPLALKWWFLPKTTGLGGSFL